MTSEKLLEYIGQIDDRYIAEVDFPVDKSSSGTRIRWFKLMAVAAAVVCVASAALALLQNVVFNIHRTVVPNINRYCVFLYLVQRFSARYQRKKRRQEKKR